ncbi:Helix-turn-helix domain-containing protein [Bradyrhizobium sp. Rc3b]|uniref:helix-turn-helix domain-containing protein n=1 Tax=Bradyrhizobium sp. Rc3b TaxID=1855322 RepID=UPI0008E91F06|nr:helix-turn-helix domain-containing protein [Bradyrhizobium sp. Rc3b]SFM57033.1 Helix-turn-helix domain-containing protein [Bradyrhizobium sp. Rc3b]
MPENREKHNGKTKFYISPTDRLDLLSALTKAQAKEQAKGKKHKKLLEQVDLFVMVALIGHRNNKTGQCDPSHATIAREIGVSVSSVQRSFKRLVKAGFIATTARYSNGSKASSQVDIDFQKGELWITRRGDDKSPVTDGPITDDRGVQSQMTGGPVIDDHEVRSAVTDKPGAVNPEKEPSELNPAASRREGSADLDSSQDRDRPKAGNGNVPDGWPTDWHDQFWNASPERKNVKATEEALIAIAKTGVKFESILIAARRRCKTENVGYYRDPVKWLADEPWLDNDKARERDRRAREQDTRRAAI